MKVIFIVERAWDNKPIRMFLKSYDPDAHQGQGFVGMTKHRVEAMRFEDAPAAWECWRQTSRVRPKRSDGKPNRPLTAYTILVENAEGGPSPLEEL